MKINRYKYLLFSLITLVQNGYGQDNVLDSLFKEFRNDVQYRFVSWNDEKRETYYSLMNICPIDTLIKYTDDPNPAISCYMFLGLARKNIDEKILDEILNKHLNDTAKFSETSTDVVLTYSAIEYMKMIFDAKAKHKLYTPDYNAELKRIREKPHFIFNGVHHDIISKDNLLKIDSLNYSDTTFKISSFTLTISKDGNLDEYKSSNNALTSEMRDKIKELESGNKLFFEIIKVIVPDGSTRILSPIYLKLQ